MWGCSSQQYFTATYEPWREQEERACLASGYVQPRPWLQTRSSLGGPTSYCGAMQPFEMAAADEGRVSLKPAALLRCNMIPAVETWIRRVVEPEVWRHYQVPLVELKVAASYGCRPQNNQVGAKLSEHGHANAVDISGFVLADGRTITVKQGWRGDPRDSSFLHAIFRGACGTFTTVLGPEANSYHQDHFHLDLAHHTGAKQIYCH